MRRAGRVRVSIETVAGCWALAANKVRHMKSGGADGQHRGRDSRHPGDVRTRLEISFDPSRQRFDGDIALNAIRDGTTTSGIESERRLMKRRCHGTNLHAGEAQLASTSANLLSG